MLIDQLFDGTPGVQLTVRSFECGFVGELRFSDGTNLTVGPVDTATDVLRELARKYRDTEPAPSEPVHVEGDGPRGSEWVPPPPTGANGPSEPMPS